MLAFFADFFSSDTRSQYVPRKFINFYFQTPIILHHPPHIPKLL